MTKVNEDNWLGEIVKLKENWNLWDAGAEAVVTTDSPDENLTDFGRPGKFAVLFLSGVGTRYFTFLGQHYKEMFQRTGEKVLESPALLIAYEAGRISTRREWSEEIQRRPSDY